MNAHSNRLAATKDVITEEEPKLLITLVHGTWGRFCLTRRARWFDKEGRLFKELSWTLRKRGTPYSIEAFKWSGANSVFARDREGAQLAELLDQQHRLSPSSVRLVVAHSHGGNLAIRAARHLQEGTDHLFIATLATPFAEIRRLELSKTDIWILVLTTLVLSFFGASLAAPVIWTSLQRFASYGEFAAPVVTILVFCAIAVTAFFFLRFSSGLNIRLEQSSSHAILRSARIPLLVLRGIDDEASLVLSAGSCANRLVDIGLRIISYLPRVALIGTGIFLLPLFLIAGSLGVLNAIGFLISILPVLFLLAGCFKSVYGRELLLSGIDIEINSHSVPDNLAQATVVTLRREQRRGALRHALYDEGDCATVILGWVGVLSRAHGIRMGGGPTRE